MTDADKKGIEEAEDAEDLVAAREAVREDGFTPWEDVKKELGI